MDVRYYLRDLLAELRGKKIADVGCGAGLLIDSLHYSNQIFGVDTDEKSIVEAKKRIKNVSLSVGDSGSLPSNEFDVVIYSNLIEVVENKPALVKEAVRLLKPNGVLFLTTPNRKHFCYKGRSKMSYQELNNLLTPYFNFQIKGWNPFPPWPYWPPARVLARLPVYYELLKWLCERSWFKESGKTFIVRGVKKRI